MAVATELLHTDQDAVRRHELAAFLRSRRERITPEQVGLRYSRRRRTPGLRREEVAQLAGVGVTWYTWIEQGRDVNASAQVLDAISRTLLFDPQERSHLFTLAGATDTTIEADTTSLPPATRLLLDRLEPFPGVVVNGRYDILAWNRIWASAFPMLDDLPAEDRNALWLIFTHPHWKRLLPDWDDAASRMVAQFRVSMAEHVAEPAWKALVARLQRASLRVRRGLGATRRAGAREPRQAVSSPDCRDAAARLHVSLARAAPRDAARDLHARRRGDGGASGAAPPLAR